MTQQPRDHVPDRYTQYHAGRARADHLRDNGVTPQEIIQRAWESTSGTVYALAMLERGKEIEMEDLQR